MRQLKQYKFATLQGSLFIAEYQSELDDKCFTKDSHAALMGAKFAEIKSEIAALKGENPIDVAAVGGGATHGFLTSTSIVSMGGAGSPSLSSGGNPWHPLKSIGDKDERVWNAIDFQGFFDAITHGYFRHRAGPSPHLSSLRLRSSRAVS